MSVQWADPPPIGGPQDPRSVWMERLRLVKENPMQWAKVASGSPGAMNQAAAQLRSRNYHVPPGRWEFTMRTFRRGVHVGDQHIAQLYARYLGDGDNANNGWDKRLRDADGRLICPKCGDILRITPGHTSCATHGYWLYRDAPTQDQGANEVSPHTEEARHE